ETTRFARQHLLRWWRAADRLVDELEARATLQRLEGDPHFGELARATRLLLVDVLLGDRLREGFTIGDLRLTHHAFDVDLRADAVERHFEVQLAHAAQNRLAGFAIGLEVQRRIGAHHLAERRAE